MGEEPPQTEKGTIQLGPGYKYSRSNGSEMKTKVEKVSPDYQEPFPTRTQGWKSCCFSCAMKGQTLENGVSYKLVEHGELGRTPRVPKSNSP